MKNKYKILFSLKRCIGCHSCEIHCTVKNDLPPGVSFCSLTSSPPKRVNGMLRVKFSFKICYHCKEPKCASACPESAIEKRARDGLVLVNESLCNGCQMCMTACPWQVFQWNEEKSIVFKCNYCLDRLEEGLKPACVAGCTTDALKLEVR
jgi:Fe-S-cluster-containing dehydrogenase component